MISRQLFAVNTHILEYNGHIVYISFAASIFRNISFHREKVFQVRQKVDRPPVFVCVCVCLCVCVYACMLCCFIHVQLFATLWNIQPSRLLCPWDSPDKNIGVGCQALLSWSRRAKQVEIFHLWTKIPRQEWLDKQGRRLGPAKIKDKRPYTFHSQSQETSPTAHEQKGSLEVKRGVMSTDTPTHRPLLQNPSWLRDSGTHERILDTPNTDSTRQVKVIDQRKPGSNASQLT